jgi:hypothetical protein
MTATLTVDAELADHLVRFATLAPSVHNTQPWHFVRRDDGLDLRADRTRQLTVLDPDGRQLVQSCGAALHHLRVAARGAGLDPTVVLVPDPADPDLLARVVLRQGRPPGPDEVASAVAQLSRSTARGRFVEEALPEALLDELRIGVEGEGARLRVVRASELIDVQVLVSRAEAYLETDPAYREELARWVRDGGPDGIPIEALGEQTDRAELVPGRVFLSRPGSATVDPPVAEHPSLVLLLTDGDNSRDWMVAGQALSNLLLQCAQRGVVAQPIGQVTDIPSTRQALAAALGVIGRPQMLLRLGRGVSGHHTLRHGPEDVLDV